MRYILFLLALLFANVAQAIDCQTPPDCTSLGYVTENDPSCAANGYVYCPFDENYKKCVDHDCEAQGFTKDDKTSWCKNIATCRGNSKYTLCVKATCEIGDVYYADGSCGLVEDFNGSKTPVGVVYYVSDGGYHGKVINLKDLTRVSESSAFDPANPYNGSINLYWGYYNYDIPELTNYNSNDNMLTQLQNREQGLYDGKSNTDKILKATKPQCGYNQNQKEYYQYCMPQAAQAAHDFYPLEELKEDSKVGQGKWYLTALGELMDLHGYNNSDITNFTGKSGANGNTKDTVNTTLTALKSKGVTAAALSGYYYWSSSAYNSSSSWNFGMNDGNRVNLMKNEARLVRASLEF